MEKTLQREREREREKERERFLNGVNYDEKELGRIQ